MKKKYYITTPIYYPSGNWHIGTCYTTVVCDCIARYKRMMGFDVFYLTGTDEHGMKVESKAKEAGVTPKQYVDEKIDKLKALWKLLGISYDKFIRTTDKEHEEAVQKIFTKLYEKGDIYKGEYEGWYCVPCESFWTKTQLVDGKCPDCGREVKLTKEESYFFRMSKYQDALTDLIKNNPEFLLPKSRQNEMLNNFLEKGLQDLAVSRTSFSWGIPVPFDPKHVIYVWIDALTNYITALGYTSENDELFRNFWPADLHMMGKEIIRFHSLIWPALLMALDLPLPKQVYGHGWLTLGGDKISKSKGNLVDPVVLCDRYGVDAVRYYLLREVPFGQDGNYTNEALLKRINNDLVNDLGNLVKRTTAMAGKYFDNKVNKAIGTEKCDAEVYTLCENITAELEKDIEGLQIPEALSAIWGIVKRANKYIDENEPWRLAQDESKKARLNEVIYTLLEAIRFVGVSLIPFIPDTAARILTNIGLSEIKYEDFSTLSTFGNVENYDVNQMDALFLRLDIEKEIKDMETIAAKASDPKDKAEEKPAINYKPQINYEQFDAVDLKVGKVLACEKVEKADKLLKLTVDVGEEQPRTIVSGIAKYYTPDEMVGKSVVVVVNLAPIKLRGIMSQGMILCATGENDSVVLVSPISGKGLYGGSTVR